MAEVKSIPERGYIGTSKGGAKAYAIGIQGDFLAPDVVNGGCAVFDPEAGRPSKGEIVAVWPKGENGPLVVRLALALPPADLQADEVFEPVVAIQTARGIRYVSMEKIERVDRLVDVVQ